MSYVVLARKYRPMRFADMVGQEHIGRTLGNAIRQDRVHHAYLFAGARGLGKTTTARIFAKALVCEQGPTPEPCNVCAQCIAVTEGRSVDVIEIDGASNNSVENIRGLREQVHYLPQTARRKVYIIDEVHMLTTSAFNALLKTLEEPPAHVNFVFATTEPHKVLPTILSRVSRLDFRRVSTAEIAAHLSSILEREQLGVEPGGLRLVARAAGGSVRDAMTLLDQVLAFAEDATKVTEVEARAVLGQAERTAVAELVDALLVRDPDEVMRIFDGLTAAGHDLTVLSMQLLEDLRDLTVARVCRERELFVDATAEELDELMRRAGVVETVVLAQTFDRLWRVVDRLATARSQRLVLEMGLLEIAQREPLVPLGDLVERLQALESGGAMPEGGGATTPARGASRGSAAAPARGRKAAADDEEAPPLNAQRSTLNAQRSTLNAQRSTLNASPPPPSEPVDAPPPPPSEPIDAPPPPPSEPIAASPPPNEPVAASPPPSEPIAAPPPPPSEPIASAPTPSIEASPFARYLDQAKLDGSLNRQPDPDAPPTNGASIRRTAPTNGTPRPVEPYRNGSNGHTAAPPEPPPPPPTAPAVDEPEPTEPFAIWERLVARVRDVDEYASAVLRAVGLVELGDAKVRIAAPRNHFAHKELSSGDVRARIEQAALELRGARLEFELIDAEPCLPERPSIELVDRKRRDELRAAVEAEAQAHPAIAALIRDFDARIAATRPLRDP